MGEIGRNPARLIGGIYLMGSVITSGGMLTTCTAHNRNTSEVVGLFVVELPPTAQLYSVQQRLQILERHRSLKSTYILRVHDWGIDGSRIYIATDPPRGLTLRHVLDTENIDMQRAVDIACQMTRGIRDLHTQGIVGIDLRPQLITVESTGSTDHVQLDDVGLRSLLNELGYASNQHSYDLGYFDPRYLPADYTDGSQQIGPWSDIYQLGILIFELVTGRLPFVGRNHAETEMMQKNEPIPRLNQFKQNIPAALQSVIDLALAKSPSARFASTNALLSALEGIQLPPRSTSSQTNRSTDELAQIDDDIALQATIIAGHDLKNRGAGKLTPLLPTEAGIYAYLCYDKDGIEVEQFEIKDTNVVVGRLDPKRGLTPDIDLSKIDPDMTVSRKQARIHFENSRLYIE